MMKLQNTTAVVTGATGTIGGTIAHVLSAAGCDVVCHYNQRSEQAAALVESIETTGRKAIAVHGDLAREADITAMFELVGAVEAEGRLSQVKVLVNSAAMFVRGPLDEIEAATAEEVLAVNLIGPILTSREFVRLLKKRQGDGATGKIVNIADVGGEGGWGKYSVYCASKAGLISVTKSLAKELGPDITVNAVAPGMVTWPEGFSEEARARQLGKIPLRRTGRPEEVAQGVRFLLENDYVTGHVLNVDGGRVL